ncbi:MAG: dockerin type I domain-containing protein [Defluviitaleaceae bacterium]|nr:dockerin type I domain-containing protein [Defluviitaleaceae bacterium]MCL2263632.1 dockerin type I domain-containing protein [Defluviitaleaceae bacterium]
MNQAIKQCIALVLVFILGLFNVVFAAYPVGSQLWYELPDAEIYELCNYESYGYEPYPEPCNPEFVCTEVTDEEEQKIAEPELEEFEPEEPKTEEPEPEEPEQEEPEQEEPELLPENAEMEYVCQMPTIEEITLEFGGVYLSMLNDVCNDGYVYVTVSLDFNPGIWGFMAELIFDETVVTPVSIVDELGLRDLQVILPPVDGGRYYGRLVFLAHAISLSHETGAMATVRFRINDGFNCELPISIGFLDVTIDDGFGEMKELIAVETHQAVTPFGIQAFSAVAAHSSNHRFHNIVLGDVNNDGSVTSADATWLARYLVGENVEINRRNADVNLNGIIGLDDLTLLQRMLVGHNVTFGPQPDRLVIITYYISGAVAYDAEFVLRVDGVVRSTYQTQTGIIITGHIPAEGTVRVDITSGDRWATYHVQNFNGGFSVVNLIYPLYISVSSETANQGETVRVSFVLCGDRPFGGVATVLLPIEYDSTRLYLPAGEVQRAGWGRFFHFLHTRLSPGRLTVMWWGTVNDHLAGTMLNLYFTVLDNAPPGEAFVRIVDPSAGSLAGDPRPVSPENGGVNVLPPRVVLAALTQPDGQDRTVNPPGSKPMTSGLFRQHSNLTAWDNGSQVPIGRPGNTPVNFRHQSTVTGWKPHSIHGVDNASAFQFRLRTAGHENIQFTAMMKATGSGPDYWELAYSTSPTGPFTLIPDVRSPRMQAPSAFRTDTFADFNWSGAMAFPNIELPASMADRDVIYLRVVYDGRVVIANGNIAINNVVITGTPIM